MSEWYLCVSVSLFLLLAPARMVMCDMLTGSLERIINSGWFPWLLWRLGVTRFIVWKRKRSYLVTTQVGRDGQVERVGTGIDLSDQLKTKILSWLQNDGSRSYL